MTDPRPPDPDPAPTGPRSTEDLAHLRWRLAGNPALPSAVVDRLIGLADDYIGYELADRTDLSRDQVLRLARHGGAPIAIRLLQRGLLTPEEVDDSDPRILVALADLGPIAADRVRPAATSPDPAVRAALAETAHLPTELLALLAEDRDLDVVVEAASSPRLTDALAETLVAHPHVSVRRALACNERTPVHLLVALADRALPAAEHCPVCDGTANPIAEYWTCDGSHGSALDELDFALVLNPHTPAETVCRFATHPDMHLRWRLAERDDLPQEVYRLLARDPIPGVRSDLAENPAIGEDIIRELAADPFPNVRRLLAHNPAVPLDVLTELAGSAKIGPTLLPRVAAATEAEIEALATSRNPVARMLAAERRDLSPRLVDQLAQDADARVLKSVADNPMVAVSRMWEMATGHGPRVAARLAQNPACPPDLLLHLAECSPPARKALRHIAEHPHAPAAALLICLADEKARAYAAGHPALPPHTIVELLADADLSVAGDAAANPALPVSAMHDLTRSDPLA
ncbi:hypothetical protein [Catellatospora tritici]|uniref:hypothetical protein n=1 Tax=Catellatospora tritici TaxID=2851566 RepID=UPI001C2D971C|nr:hypothetical protein [Catellatospora tritici]MBV1853138.1 hypothetical protein [Catellatospora tritici]